MNHFHCSETIQVGWFLVPIVQLQHSFFPFLPVLVRYSPKVGKCYQMVTHIGISHRYSLLGTYTSSVNLLLQIMVLKINSNSSYLVRILWIIRGPSFFLLTKTVLPYLIFHKWPKSYAKTPKGRFFDNILFKSGNNDVRI